MNWIRIAVGIADDPDVHTLAERLGCRVAEAVGLLVSLLTRFPEHAPGGDLTQIPASLVERWAGWEGQRGAFDVAFRDTFLTDGVWVAWDKHNGKALAKLIRDRERIREQRETRGDNLATLALQSRDGRGGVAGTDGRTDELLRGRSRAKSGTATYAPGHANLPDRPPCPPGCALQTVEGQRRPVLVHIEGCPNA